MIHPESSKRRRAAAGEERPVNPNVIRLLRNLDDVKSGMLRGQHKCMLSQLPAMSPTWLMIDFCLCVLSLLMFFGTREHTEPEKVKLGATIHAAFDQFEGSQSVPL
jgi:hypothetical protein